MAQDKAPAVDPSDEAEKVKDNDLLEKGIDFAYTYSRNGSVSPFCSKELHFREEAKPNPIAMRAHLKKMHPTQVTVAFQADDINASFRTVDPTLDEILELSTQDEYDKFDRLYIDPDVKRAAEASGDILRWADPEKIAQGKIKGAEVLTLSQGGKDISSATAADGTARAGEMVAIRIPSAVVSRMRDRRAMQDSGQASSKEELNVQADALEKGLYDRMVKEGSTTDVARQVSRARASFLRRSGAASSRDNWGGNQSDPRARDGVSVREGGIA